MVRANWLLILYLVWPCVVDAQNSIITHHDTPSLPEVVTFIAREHISKHTTTVVIMERSLTKKTARTNALLLDYLLLSLQEKLAVQLHIRNFKNPPWEYYIFIVDSSEAFGKLLWRFPTNYYESEFNFLIILTTPTRNWLRVITEIFNQCYRFDVINANVILGHPTLGVSMFTYTLFSNDLCRIVQPLLYYTFSQGLEHLKQVFPVKLTNLHGCPMRVVSRVMEPMLIFRGNASDPKPVGLWDNLVGFEGLLLRTMADTLNFTIQLLPFAKRDICFSELLAGKADVALGGFSGSDPDRWIMSPSRTYYHSPFIYITRSGCLIGSLGRLTAPFNYQVWIRVVGFLIFGTLFTQVLRCMTPTTRRFLLGETNTTPMVNFIAIFLGYPISRTPRRNFARYLLMMCLLLTLVIRSAYQGSLYDAIRMNKFERTPSGLEDLVRWNYKLLLSTEVARLNSFPQNVTTLVRTGSHTERFEEIEQTPGKYATITLQDNFVHYMGKVYKNGSNLIMIREVVYMYQIVMYFPKHSIFMPTINKKLEAFFDAGITTSIGTDFMRQNALYWKFKQKGPRKPLTNDRLMAMYQIYGWLAGVSLVVFVFELLSVRLEWLRRVFDVLL